MEPEVSIQILWQRYVEGNKGEFRDIYLYYYPRLYTYGKSISEHSDLIDEAIQELFIRLWNKPPGKVKSIDQYMFISFRNELFRHIKYKKRHLTQEQEYFEKEREVHTNTEEKVIKDEDDQERRSQIRKALETLPSRRREALFLKFFQNKSTREISIIMNIREEMVRNYIYKGIKALRANHSNQLYLVYSAQAILISWIMGQYLMFC